MFKINLLNSALVLALGCNVQVKSMDDNNYKLLKIGAGILAGGYAMHKYLQYSNLNEAYDRLQRNKLLSDKIDSTYGLSAGQNYEDIDFRLLQSFGGNVGGFQDHIGLAQNSIGNLHSIHLDTERDVAKYNGSKKEKAVRLVGEGRAFLPINANRLGELRILLRHYQTRVGLIELDILRKSDAMFMYAGVVAAANEGAVGPEFKAIVRSSDSQAMFPFVKAVRSLNDRKALYARARATFNGCFMQTSCSADLLNHGSRSETRLQKAEQAVAGLEDYTSDLRKHNKHEQRAAEVRAQQEVAAAQQRAAQAAQLAAEAQHRQAAAQERQTRIDAERLQAERDTEVANLKIKVKDPKLTRDERRQIESRISDLESLEFCRAVGGLFGALFKE